MTLQNRETRTRVLVAVLAVVTLRGELSAEASTGKAAERVKQGISHFQAGEFEAAGRAFTEADVALPDNPRVGFDRACVYSATGDTDKATELLRDSAMSRDPELVARSRYNLGGIQAAKARGVFGEEPAAATTEVREEGLHLLVAAIGHWRDCLEVDPDHVAARQNLETVRLWIKHMQDVWAERDREKQREEMDILAMLRMIETEQTQLRQVTRQLDVEPDSPRRRQAARQSGQTQKELAEEIEPLKDKFQELFEPPASGAPASSPPPDDEQRDRALGVLNELANNARSAMLKASGNLDAGELAPSVAKQVDALDALNEIYMAIAPFQNIVQRAVGTQEPLVAASNDIVQRANRESDVSDSELPDPDSGSPEPGYESPEPDYEELTRRQTQVERWSQVLPLKADQELQQQKAAEDQNSVTPQPGASQPGGQPQIQQIQQAEMLVKAAEKAVELAPRVQELTGDATELLEQKDASGALPKQEEALALLKEIADLLPKQDQQQDGQDDQQQQQENQDDQRPSDEPQQQQPEQQKKQNPKQGQAEAVLRKVRERERQRRDREKEIQRYLRGSNRVDKDW
jgi:hypothetical protein